MKKSEENITLRKAESVDVDAVCRLWLGLMREHEAMDPRFMLSDDAALRWRNDLRLWIEDQTRKIMLVEHNDKPVGFIHAHRWVEPPVFKAEPEVYIDEVFVLPEWREKGLGKKLVDAIKAWAVAVGAHLIRLRALAANKEGMRFWEREGGSLLDLTYTIALPSVPEKENKVRPQKLGF